MQAFSPLNANSNSTPIDAALALAARGLPVFPVTANDKKPLHKNWRAMASNDFFAVQEMFSSAPLNCNVGVDCGGMIVVDADARKGGLWSLTMLQMEGVIPVDPTFTIKTPNGGLHLYFLANDATVRNSVERLAPGIDIRAAGGLVVGPGSQIDGRRYELIHDVPILGAPSALIERCGASHERKPVNQIPVCELDSPEIIRAARDFIARAEPAIEGQGGHNQLCSVARTLKDLGVSSQKAVELMSEPGGWNSRCAPPWSYDELSLQVPSIYASATERQPGVDSPRHSLRRAVQAYADVLPIVSALAGFEASQSLPRGAEPPSESPFRFWRHGDDWRSSTQWLLPEVLPASSVGLLVGPSGSGKSFLAIYLATALAKGEPFFGVAPEGRGGTIYVATEAEITLRKRLQAVADSGSALPVSIVGASNLGDRSQFEPLVAAIEAESARMKDRFGVPCHLVVVDTLSASGLLEEENDNGKAAVAMSTLQRLAQRLGALIIATHHPTKAGEGERGAGALRANVDAILTVEHQGREKFRRLALTKSRDADSPRSLGAFMLEEVTLGDDGRDRPIKTCRIVESSAEPKLGSRKPPARLEFFNECLERAMHDDAEIETVCGKAVVEKEAVRELFKACKPGSRDRGNISREFNKCVEWMTHLDALEIIREGRREYFSALSANFSGQDLSNLAQANAKCRRDK